MRAERLFALLLLLPFFSCAGDSDTAGSAGLAVERPIGAEERSAVDGRGILDFDIVNRTCALYVAVRSSAWEGPIAFGRELDDSLVHWNTCPGGTMVACAVAPTASGDTVITGIPWLHATGQSH